MIWGSKLRNNTDHKASHHLFLTVSGLHSGTRSHRSGGIKHTRRSVMPLLMVRLPICISSSLPIQSKPPHGYGLLSHQELKPTGKGCCGATDTQSRAGKCNGPSGGDTPSHCYSRLLSTFAVPTIKAQKGVKASLQLAHLLLGD